MIDPATMGGGGPAPSISLPGIGAAPEPDPAAGGDTESSDPTEMMRKALELTRKAALAEPDDEDQAMLEKLGADIAKYIGSQQKLTDSAMGAGPGVKLVRKAAGQSGPGY